jgi:hypothetical protein
MKAYLLGLSALCAEVAERPGLLPVFIQVILLVPGTIAELLRARRLAA